MKPQHYATDFGLAEVVSEAYRRSFSVSSDFARSHAPLVAMAASLGLISTRVMGQAFSSEWRPTCKGLSYINQMFDLDIEGLEESDD